MKKSEAGGTGGSPGGGGIPGRQPRGDAEGDTTDGGEIRPRREGSRGEERGGRVQKGVGQQENKGWEGGYGRGGGEQAGRRESRK